MQALTIIIESRYDCSKCTDLTDALSDTGITRNFK